MLICLTASHKNAGFDMLERLSATAEDAGRRMIAGHPAVLGAVVVATCNRFEAYLDLDALDGDSPVDAVHGAIRSVGEVSGLAAEELRSTFGFAHGNAVASHLFSVAAGLESVVVGEGEIAGQVRRSLEQARNEGTTTPELERLFQRASQTSRKIKNRTGIGSEGRSLVRLSLDLASSRVTDWTQAKVLLVGTGRYAGASLAALRDRGATDISVYSATGRGEKFAASHDVTAVPHDGFARAAADADVVIACTLADHHVVHPALIAQGRESLATDTAPVRTLAGAIVPKAERRQLIIDLGLPRNVDPAVVEIAGVELLDLETIKIHAPMEEFAATDAARDLVHRAARNFSAVGEELDLAPTVVALRKHVFDVLDAEIERARSRGDDDGTTEAALRHMAGVLLHTPMVRSRAYARAGEQRAFIDAAEAIFGVVAGPVDAAATEQGANGNQAIEAGDQATSRSA
ncbi:glutamyl-tRNA reductase [Agromyces sp. LHK192]|uniref:glutamyl-tRNA reductase n=1 Tax=Agromyces sp. LHK192 TaxID=2498704 RepID=UPI000FD7E175|nr:glutamyl-tRNA reductase [Agromyces sp. LHK192]